jgi:hypothetical protein
MGRTAAVVDTLRMPDPDARMRLRARISAAIRRASLPPIDVAAEVVTSDVPGADAASKRPATYQVELVESMMWPPGTDESTLRVGLRPRSAVQARVATTRASRELARDYRLWYGASLRTDAATIELMQRHLWLRFADGPLRTDPRDIWELRRHGALLSEILARTLRADWVDIGPTEPGYWAMLVPPAKRTCPVGRVFRFVALGPRETDLVGYYSNLLES